VSAKSNAGKLSIIAVLFAAAVALLVWTGGRQPSRSGEIRLICVATGETFWIDRGKTLMLPLENERTGQRTLLPCYEGEDGQLHVSESARRALARLDEQDLNHFVDLETLAVRKSP
jgi:hypothetical protein